MIGPLLDGAGQFNCHANLCFALTNGWRPLFSPRLRAQPASRRPFRCVRVTADAVGDAAEDPAPRARIASVSVIAETSAVMSSYTFTPPSIRETWSQSQTVALGPRFGSCRVTIMAAVESPPGMEWRHGRTPVAAKDASVGTSKCGEKYIRSPLIVVAVAVLHAAIGSTRDGRLGSRNVGAQADQVAAIALAYKSWQRDFAPVRRLAACIRSWSGWPASSPPRLPGTSAKL